MQRSGGSKSADLISKNGVEMIDLNNLRSERFSESDTPEQLFWNLIYYFNEYHLPYEFILPYEDKQFEKDLKRYEVKGKKVITTIK